MHGVQESYGGQRFTQTHVVGHQKAGARIPVGNSFEALNQIDPNVL